MNSTVHLQCFYISRRVEVDKKNQQHHARHLDNYGLQKTIFHVSLPLDGVGHTRVEGEVFEFFWRSSVLDFYWERQGGVKLWHPNGRKKTWEAHGDFYTFLHFSRPFYERKEVFFSKDVLNWLLISDLSLGIRKLFLALLWGRKITFQEQRMNGMLMKNIVVVKDLSASILKCW